jgi:hypothetical protein
MSACGRKRAYIIAPAFPRSSRSTSDPLLYGPQCGDLTPRDSLAPATSCECPLLARMNDRLFVTASQPDIIAPASQRKSMLVSDPKATVRRLKSGRSTVDAGGAAAARPRREPTSAACGRSLSTELFGGIARRLLCINCSPL